ncbi:uncharacterized protein JCM6883_004506 [Sporobolomyces salmoneus]|uniref:uncharacterized protein n=1 Tax=Sporobolomyces salmoneus TaxID=183962 RepID=UPI003179B897
MSADSPTFTIKKRKGPKASTSKLSFGSEIKQLDEPSSASSTTAQNGADEDEGSAVVIRNRGKKTPAGRIKEREKGKLSFGSSSTASNEMQLDADDSSFVKRSISSAASTPKRGLLRTTLSAVITSNPQPATPSASTSTASGGAGGGIYSKEYLDQLKSSQLSAPRPTATSTTTGNEQEYDELTMSKFGSGTDIVDDVASTIPTTNAIAQAKARREELRKTGGSTSSDYISLSGSGSISTVGFASKGGDSRLVREDDELGDGDEDLADFTGSFEKIPLGRKANREAAIKLKGEIGEMIEEVEEEKSEEEDEEMKRWEEAQIRRGAEEGRARGETNNNVKKTYRPMPIPQLTTLPSLSAVTSRLSLSLSTLQSSHTLDQASLSHFTHEREDLDKQERELRVEVEKTEKKSRWFEEFKETVEDWAAFLDEKFPQLERIEKEYLNIQKERFEIISRRRLADDSDGVALFTGSSIPDTRTRLLKSQRVDREEDVTMQSEDETTDLEPRSILRTTRRAERQRRFQETPSSSSTSAYPDPLLDPSYSSDSSLSPTETSDLATALASLDQSLSTLFSDVKNDDFRDPNLGIRKKFEEWRELWNEEYGMLFGSLGLVGVWEFWARVEMGRWNPFEIEQLPKTPSDLSQYAWHQALSSYGHREHSPSTEEQEEEEPQDESTEVINALVTSVVIPRLSELARESYDPYSSHQTVAAVKLVDEISYCVERDSPKFESLIQAFLHRIRLEIHTSQLLLLPHLTQLSLPSLSYDPSTFLARQHFLSRQLKLLRSCMRWRRFMRSLRLPILTSNSSSSSEEATGQGGEGAGIELPANGETFDELIMRELVAKVMLPLIEVSWATGGEEISRKVLEVLPKDGKVVNEALRRRLQGENVQ